MSNSDLCELLTRWCNQNSGSGNLTGLAAMLDLLVHEFSSLSRARIERVNLPGTSAQALRVTQRPNAARQILFSGHYDTVYDAEHPFQSCTALPGEQLQGPGTADMKGGLVVLLAALRQFEATPDAEKVGWEIIVTPDEETGSIASAHLLASAAARFDFALVVEPARANGDLVKSRKGTGIFAVTVHGRAAHAGRDPEAGRNAILALAEILLSAAPLPEKLPGVMLNVGAIRGGGAANIVPDLASADLNVRVTKNEDAAGFMKALHEIIAPWNSRDGYRVEVTGSFNRPPKESTAAEEQIFAAWQECGKELGLKFSWQHVGGGSDGNLLAAAGLANLDGLGVVGDGMHSPREFVWLPSLRERAELMVRFLDGAATNRFALPQRKGRDAASGGA